MACRQVSSSAPGAGVPSTQPRYKTEAECLQACKEGACCEGTTCSVKPQCQCQGTGNTFKGVGTVCEPNPCAPCCANDRLPHAGDVLVNLSFAMPAESFLKQLPIHGYAMNPPLSFSASAVVPVVASAQRNGAFVEFDLDCEVPSVVASAVSIVFINSRYYSEPAAGTQWAYYYGDYGESISSASLQSVICSSANNSGCQFRALVEFQCPAAAPASANLGPYIRWEYPPPGTTFTLQGGLQYYTSHGGVRYVTGIDPAVIFGIGGGRLLTANVSGLACFTTSFDLVSDRQNTWIYGNPSFGVPDFANHVNQVVGSLSLSNV